MNGYFTDLTCLRSKLILNRLFRSNPGLVLGAVLATLVVVQWTRADDAMNEARDALVLFDWDGAYQKFTAIAKSAPPKSEAWAQATFGAAAAVCNRQPASKDYADTAAALYQSIIDSTPDSKYAPRALMNLARIKELRDYPGDQPDLDGATQLYLKVASNWPDRPIASEATLRAASAMVQAYDVPDFAKVKQGVSLLESWIAAHPADPMQGVMLQYLGDIYFMPLGDTAKANHQQDKMIDYYKKSLACYDKVDAIGWVDAGNQGPVYWRMAVLSETVGNLPSAIKYYTKNITETPNSGKAYESQLALKRLGAPVPAIDIRAKAKKSSPTTQRSSPTTQEASR